MKTAQEWNDNRWELFEKGVSLKEWISKIQSDAFAAGERKGRIEAKELKVIRDALESALAGVWDGYYRKGVEVSHAQSINTQVVNALKTLDRLKRKEKAK